MSMFMLIAAIAVIFSAGYFAGYANKATRTASERARTRRQNAAEGF